MSKTNPEQCGHYFKLLLPLSRERVFRFLKFNWPVHNMHCKGKVVIRQTKTAIKFTNVTWFIVLYTII